MTTLGARAHTLLPYINFFVASSALAFQIIVLYPSQQVLKQEQAALLSRYHELKIQRFTELERQMVGLERRMQALGKPPSGTAVTHRTTTVLPS